LRLTADGHKASRGLSATAELLVTTSIRPIRACNKNECVDFVVTWWTWRHCNETSSLERLLYSITHRLIGQRKQITTRLQTFMVGELTGNKPWPVTHLTRWPVWPTDPLSAVIVLYCRVGSKVVVVRPRRSDNDRAYNQPLYWPASRPRWALPRPRPGVPRSRLPDGVQGRVGGRRDGGHSVARRRGSQRRLPALAASSQTNTATTHTSPPGSSHNCRVLEVWSKS